MSQRDNLQAPIGVVFDGDDTLWTTEILYDVARSEAAVVVQQQGLDRQLWEEIERRLDVQNLAIYGFGPQRFPTSCVEAYEEMCQRVGRRVDRAVVDRVWDLASAVFERDPVVKPGAREILEQLRRRGVRLALLTKGDRQVQERRIASSGLGDLFDIIRIVEEKTPESLLEAVGALGAEPQSAWMVGNSVRSDVLPALAAGLKVIWIDAHVWEYERAQRDLVDDRVIAASELEEIPGLIAA